MKTLIITLITICALIAWTNALAIDRLPTGAGAEGVAVNPLTQTAVVANKGPGTLSIIDMKTRQVVSTIEVGGTPVGPKINEKTNTVVFSDKADGTVVLLDLASGAEKARISVGSSPSCVAVDAEHNIATVGCAGDNSVYVIDLASEEVKYTIPVSPWPVCMHWCINPNNMTAIVANRGGDTITVMDIENGVVLKTITIGRGPGPGPALNPLTNTAIVPFNSNKMAIVDLDTDTVTHTVPVGGMCTVIHEEANVGFISNMGDGSVSAIDLDTGTIVTTFEDVGQGPTCMAVDVAQNLLLVTNMGGGDVALISLDSIIDTAASTKPQGKRSTVWGWVKETSH